MNTENLHHLLLQDFNLIDLPEEDQEDMLYEVYKTIQKQFFLDVYDIVGKDQFNALIASAQMGEEFYLTTLKHMLPTYEEIFESSRKKVVAAFHG